MLVGCLLWLIVSFLSGLWVIACWFLFSIIVLFVRCVYCYNLFKNYLLRLLVVFLVI